MSVPHVPECISELRGVEISLELCEENPAHEGHGDEYLEDWYIDVCVTSDGTSPHVPFEGEWWARIVRAKERRSLDIKSEEVEIVPLTAGAELHYVRLKYTAVGGIGPKVFIFIVFSPAEDPGEKYAHAYALPSVTEGRTIN